MVTITLPWLLTQVKQCSAIPAALQWVEVTDITLAVEQGGAVNCVKHIRYTIPGFRYLLLSSREL